MSIYDHRDRPAYTNSGGEPHYSKNPHILQWWTPSHDEILAKQIEKEQWVWYLAVTDKIVAVTEPDIIEIWKLVDPLRSKYAWYNVLNYFAIARADKLGLTKAIKQPQWEVCIGRVRCKVRATRRSVYEALADSDVIPVCAL